MACHTGVVAIAGVGIDDHAEETVSFQRDAGRISERAGGKHVDQGARIRHLQREQEPAGHLKDGISAARFDCHLADDVEEE